MKELVLKVEDICKHYRLGVLGSGTLKEGFKKVRKKLFSKETTSYTSTENDIWALKNINFEIYKGEVIGLVGKNGSGKSTLLKILSRVVLPTQGKIKGIGKTSSLLEVGTGFHAELTGRENIYLNGQILGLSKNQVDERFDQIVEFSEIEQFIDTPVKRYSSGMYVRLAFAVAAHLQSDILIVDEVLAVGDGEFQQKCIEKMRSIAHDEGRTVLFVSHNLQILKKLCTRLLFLSKGELITEGKPVDVINQYITYEQNNSYFKQFDDIKTAPGSEEVKIRRVELLPQYLANNKVLDIRTPIDINFEFWLNFKKKQELSVSVVVFTIWGDCIFEITSEPEVFENGLVNGGCKIPAYFLNDNSYTLTLAFISNNKNIFFSYDSCLSFDISNYLKPKEWAGHWIGYTRPNIPVKLFNKS